MLLNKLLAEHYQVRLVNSGQKALDFFTQQQADLVLLDVMMPEMDGYEVCRRLLERPSTRKLPILFITAKNSAEDEQDALSAGGNDFITKHINPKVLLARISTHLKVKAFQDFLAKENERLEQMVEERLSGIFKLQDASLAVMISLAEFRDECTGFHIKRTQHYIRLLAVEVSESLPEYQLTSEQVEMIAKSAPLHDIGKITIPDHILLKPGKLTDEEFAIMKTHAQKGYDILRSASANMGDYGDFLTMAQQVALTHHEKWDGTGYPNGLAGREIPLAGRLMAIVDVYDALRSARPYKHALSHEQALVILQEGKGSHFDAQLVDAFVRIGDVVKTFSEQWQDHCPT
ncbi:MAG: response regulator [Gammaproteobacteria bacterium]|nr:response regulator [Gammaproteobacteria bacterium]